MANFDKSMEITAKMEGGYTAGLLNDSGGETIFGVARNKNPNWKGWIIVDNYKASYTSFEKSNWKELEMLCLGNGEFLKYLKEIYKTYWNAIKGELIDNQKSANVLFDMTVNAGVKRACILAQEVIKVTADGIFGPKSLEGVNNTKDFAKLYTDKRIEWYESRDSKYDHFKKGWVNRARSVLNFS